VEDKSGLEINAQVSEVKQETPFTLREYGEIPKGYVPLYIAVNKDRLGYVAENGFRVIDNQSIKKHGNKIEEIFIKAGNKYHLKVSRTNCIFASPRPPHQTKRGLSFREKEHALFGVMIDPADCIVVEGEYFTEASADLVSRTMAEERAGDYWESKKTLKEYISEGHDGSDDDWDDYQFPEVLIPFDIPTTMIKLVENYRNTRYD